MKNKSKIVEWIKIMNNMFPSNKTELVYSTSFQLLVAVMLSAQTTDKQVNKVTKYLFKIIKEPQDIMDLWLEKLEYHIKSIWIYKQKAKNIYNSSKLLIQNSEYINWNKNLNYKIPEDINDLMKLPWVWIKTAKVVLHVLYNQRYIAVDTHVQRVVNRLWRVESKNEAKTSELLEELIPENIKDIAHHSLILFGRYHCKSRLPNCKECKLSNNCLRYKKLNL